MKNKQNLLILSSLLLSVSASASTTEYQVSLYKDVPEVIEVGLVDETGNPAPLTDSMEYELMQGQLAGEMLVAENIFEGYKLSSNTQGAQFEIIRSVSPLTLPTNFELPQNDIIRTRVAVINSDCDEQINNLSVLFPFDTGGETSTSTLTEGGRLCPTNVVHEYYAKKFPSGSYSADFKLIINSKL